ncbi:hypothetical protein [Methanospirillum lacunae]|uniref:Glycosyltransferase RgtA/B/C/D-like domain-containing protein n=1 Tax=Methanospirillum lacunae TaxID=668570 RepID=A0A2V2N5S0_9EURY|nr:hypothetical protein [Methanospirillum lacunae]PWR71567.1 hypothetical protein DK846_11985 [Methanospirillum lacunae]
MNRSLYGWFKCLIEIGLLLLTNGIANYLFIRHYTYYSDDWSDVITSPDSSRTYLSVLSDCQRPIQFALKKLAFSFHGADALSLQLAGLVLSSIFLILLYLIIRKIATDFGYLSYLPFVSCLLYVVMWNKDEAYPWIIVSICNEVGFLFFAGSILCYLYRDKRFFLPVSLLFYFLGLLTYETGIAIPVLFLVYDLLKGRKIRDSLYYLFPLGLVMLIRTTQWFGFGYVRYGHDVSSFDPTVILLHTGLFIFTSLLILSNQVQFSVMGWMQVTPLQGFGILACNILLILIISFYLRLYRFVERGSFRYLLILITGLVVTSVPIILTTGGTPTRGYILIDIFVATLVAYLGIRACGAKYARVVLMALIFCSLLICQGLYVNWVESGEISDNVAGYICSHSGEIGKYPYLYVNSTDFVKNAPNSLGTAYHPTREDLFRLKRDVLGNQFDDLITKLGNEDVITRIDSGYVQYYNAKCLDQWAFDGMLKKCGLRNVTLIYGGNWYGNFPTYAGNNQIRYQQYDNYHPTGPEVTIPRSKVYEITWDRITSSDLKPTLTLF